MLSSNHNLLDPSIITEFYVLSESGHEDLVFERKRIDDFKLDVDNLDAVLEGLIYRQEQSLNSIIDAVTYLIDGNVSKAIGTNCLFYKIPENEVEYTIAVSSRYHAILSKKEGNRFVFNCLMRKEIME